MKKDTITSKDVQDYAIKNGMTYMEAKKAMFKPKKSHQDKIQDEIVKK